MLIELFAEYGLFLAKVVTFVIAIIVVIGVVVSSSQRDSVEAGGRLEIKKLNDRYTQMADALRFAISDQHAIKVHDKTEKQNAKVKDKTAKAASKKKLKQNIIEQDKEETGNVYVLDFDGDMKASAVESFREEITAILTMATEQDEVVVRLESPGGMVHAYGLASSQLARFRSANIPLTVCVDKVAASGGYMMACIADKLYAAPFAVIGSIGVVASLPNFNKVLKKYDVDYELLTAGEYKRTLTMLGENTEAGRNKFIEDLEQTHDLFKDFVEQYRPKLDITAVATGETWYGKTAIDNKLIDAISTSDEYIASRAKEVSVYEVKYVQKKSIQEKIGLAAQGAMESTMDKWLARTLQHWNNKH